MRALFHRDFEKQLNKFQPSVREQFYERLALFLNDPHHPLLHIHELSGKYRGFWNMNVTGDIRAVYEMLGKEVTHFVDIGTHHQLFGS